MHGDSAAGRALAPTSAESWVGKRAEAMLAPKATSVQMLLVFDPRLAEAEDVDLSHALVKFGH